MTVALGDLKRKKHSQSGTGKGLRTPPGTVSLQTPHPKRCPRGSARLCEEDMVVFQVSSPKNTTADTSSSLKAQQMQLYSKSVYLVKWKGEHIRWTSFIPVKGVNLLHFAVIHTNDAQVKFLYSHYVSQYFNIPAEPGAFNGHDFLEILQHEGHFITFNLIKNKMVCDKDLGYSPH